jgi:hypothetical protein
VNFYSALGSAVGKLQALTSLRLDFERSSKLSDKLREDFRSKEGFFFPGSVSDG